MKDFELQLSVRLLLLLLLLLLFLLLLLLSRTAPFNVIFHVIIMVMV